MMRLLLVENSRHLADPLSQGLGREGYVVDIAADGEEARAAIDVNGYECIVLDLVLPKLDGLAFLREIRERGTNTDILVLSANGEVEHRVRVLEHGADGCLVKPFAFEELRACLEALRRRRHGQKSPAVRFGSLVLNTALRRAERGGADLGLTRSEYRLFEFLAQRRGRVYSKEHLIDALYPFDSDVSLNVIEVVVSNLRKKLRFEGEEPLVRTRRGFGYYIEDE